jgi:arylformamidase
MHHWIDISTPLTTGMPRYPGDPPVNLDPIADLARGDDYNARLIHMSAHTGTHMDAPLHFIAGGASLDDLPLDLAVGPATLIDRSDLDHATGDRLLIKGGELTEAQAASLAVRGVRLVGVEGLTVGSYETHRILLRAGVWILEGLQLEALPPGPYDLICLPLRIANADGAPARAIVRPAAG